MEINGMAHLILTASNFELAGFLSQAG